MTPDAREKIEGLSDNNTWLFEHMIIAFWHGFGIANGLSIQKEDVETIHYKEGPRGYQVKKEVMREKLREYLHWLESYKKGWSSEHYRTVDPEIAADIKSKLDNPEHGWGDITRMIELLQI